MNQATIKAENKRRLWKILTDERGAKCEMCGRALTGSNGDGILHHRHYRTIDKNFNVIGELTGDELSILCFPCHMGLHYRHASRQLEDRDWNFVDPEWSKNYYNQRTKPFA